jgi:chromosomal replication initiator protein
VDSPLWTRCAQVLAAELPEAHFNTWVRPLQALESDGTLRLLAPNRFAVDWVNANLLGRIGEWLQAEYGAEAPIVTVQVGERHEPAPATKSAAAAALPATARGFGKPTSGIVIGARLNPDTTFETFVVGKSNQLAKAAAQQVGENPGTAYNPLFIYGGVGLGKTHLMHAVGHAIQARKPDARIAYVHSERFVSDMVKALQHNQMNEFKAAYRSLDALLIDDIQFFAGKERSQEEFFHTFNALVDQNKQIVISADRAPGEIKDLEDRIKSRLQCGLVVDLHPTDYELRLGILQQKAEFYRQQYPGLQIAQGVLDFLAHRITTNVRVLEGALTRLFAFASLVGREITLELAQDCLADILRASDRKLTIEEIQRKVAEHYNIRLSDMIGPKRLRNIARPRQVAMYLAKQLTPRSLPEIGRRFGGRDHTTIMHGVKKIEELMATDSQLNDDLNLLKRLLQG